MEFQTNVLRAGQWVTQTIDLNAILRANAGKGSRKSQHFLGPQPCGILTKTVFESPLVHWILPARLRSPGCNDVAFVGDHFVDIREFKKDEQLYDVIRKKDFGSRIRNARVIGASPTEVKDEGGVAEAHIKPEEDEDVDMGIFDDVRPSPPGSLRELPPQMLLLVLECGDCIFLHVRTAPDGKPDIVTWRFKSPSPRVRLAYPGFHLAVDPSSRYVALGCPESLFVVYELGTVESLCRQERSGEQPQPVISYRPRSIQGVIHKMEFLYPTPGHERHIILLLIVVRNDASRMVIYEWEVGDNLKNVLAEEKNGHRMPEEHQMPLLLIPLTVRSAFLAISPNHIAMCRDVLHGPPNFEVCQISNSPPSDNHIGRGDPLWTAWARPFRLRSFLQHKDCIYLAREDGRVVFLEIGKDSTLEGSIPFNQFDCNVSTAFSCIYDQSSDILVLGGDSGPGQIWKAPPRSRPIQLGTLPNWSPTIDFVTTDEFTTWNQEVGWKGARMVSWQHRQRSLLAKPDRIFSTSGRGKKGSVTEFRYGLAAKIGLVLDCEAATRRAWLFHASPSRPEHGYHLLFSTPDRSSVLHLPADLSDLSEPEADTVPYDLSSQTLAAAKVSDGLLLQITEKSTTIIHTSQSVRFSHVEVLQEPHLTVTDATVFGNWIILSTHSQNQFHLHTLRIDDLSLKYGRTYSVDGEITCISFGYVSASPYVLAGIWKSDCPWLALYPAEPAQHNTATTIQLRLEPTAVGDDNGEAATSSMEALASMASVVTEAGRTVIVLGTRSGDVLTVELGDLESEPTFHRERFGLTSATVYPVTTLSQPAILVCSDFSLMLMLDYEPERRYFKTKHRVWPVDAGDLSATSPPVHSAAIIQPGLTEREGTLSLLLVSTPRILLAELELKAGPVQRHLPVGGTPMKVLFSHHLECLIVAVSKGGCPTLVFLDPDTGEDLSRPTDKDGKDVDFISGLGKADDRIYGLNEWEYRNGTNIWRFILVSTRDGRLLVVSTSREDVSGHPPTQKIRYWTRWKQPKASEPIFSVLGLADGIVYCVGETLRWDILDLDDKKLKPMKSFVLNSPASSLRVFNGKIAALTTRDSLQIIDYHGDDSDEMKLLHADFWVQKLTHLVEVADVRDVKAPSSLVLVSDRDCGVTGLWVPWNTPGKDCEVVFEAELPASIRKFRRGRTRPAWLRDQRTAQYGVMPSTLDDAELLGMCLDGSVEHFTLLGLEIWELLRFIQNLALLSPELYPFAYDRVDEDFDVEPKAENGVEMQVDGDMLQRCLDRRALERLVSRPSHVSRLMELLDEIDDSRWTADFEGSEEEKKRQYFRLAYDILEYYLAPML